MKQVIHLLSNMFSYSPGVYNPPNCFYTQIAILLNESEMRQLVGNNGCNFKYLTRTLDIQYIWWNKSSNVIEVWGKNYNLLSAKMYIQKYIENFKFATQLKRCNAATPEEFEIMTENLIIV